MDCPLQNFSGHHTYSLQLGEYLRWSLKLENKTKRKFHRLDTYDTDRREEILGRGGGNACRKRTILRYLNDSVIIFFNQITLNISSENLQIMLQFLS